MDPETKALVYVIPTIALVMVVLFAAGYLITSLLGLPSLVGEPLWVRLIGAPIVVAGLAQMGWLFRYREFRNVLVSTFVTFKKMAGRAPLNERLERREPLVIAGPYRYVRHPLYFGVVVMVLGWAIISNYTFVFVSAVLVFAWFRLVIAPYEERELKAIFGHDFEVYSKSVPSMVPFTKFKPRQPKHGSGPAPTE